MPPRSRNFNGCWTCRLRKIKCDATRPVCLRCQKANLQCKGYAVVLAWADSASVDPSGRMVTVPMAKTGSELERDGGSLRRSVELSEFPPQMRYDSYARLNEIVSLFDDEQKVRGGLVVGPFSVYLTKGGLAAIPVPAVPTKPVPTNPPPKVRTVPAAPVAPTVPAIARLQPESREYTPDTVPLLVGASFFSKTENSYVHYELLDFAKLTILAIKGPRYKFTEQGVFHILYPKFFPNIESDHWRPNTDILLQFFSTSAGAVTLSPRLSSTMGFLTARHISFVRVAHPRNSWDVFVVPFLKQILYELACEELPKSNNWLTHIIPRDMDEVPRSLFLKNIRLCILCMTLAISCFQQAALQPKVPNKPDSYHVNEILGMAIELRKAGINFLNFHLDEYDNSLLTHTTYDTYLLLAMILQIELDNEFGVYENYELVYAIGEVLLLKEKHRGTLLEKYLRDLFGFLTVFYQSTQAINFFNYSIPETDRKLKYLDLNENYDLTKQSDELSESSSESESDGKEIMVTPAGGRNEATGSPMSFAVSFKRSEAPKPKEKLQRKNVGSPIIPLLKDINFYVECGLPKSLMQLFNEVIQLTNHKNVFRTNGVSPRNFPRICAETEDKIINWNVESYWKLYDNEYNPISNVAKKSFLSDFHESLYYYVTSFHHALIVYYKRLISVARIENYQQHIEESLNAMEKLMALTLRKREFSFSPSFWAILVCGCDIDLKKNRHLRDQCQRLWTSECFYKYNYWRSKQILYEVWNRSEETGEQNGFMDMIREWGVVLSLG